MQTVKPGFSILRRTTTAERAIDVDHSERRPRLSFFVTEIAHDEILSALGRAPYVASSVLSSLFDPTYQVNGRSALTIGQLMGVDTSMREYCLSGDVPHVHFTHP